MNAKNLIPDPAIKKIWRLIINIFNLIALLIFTFLGIAMDSYVIFLALLIAYCVLIYFPLILYIPAYYKSLKYEIYSDHIQIHKGVFWKRHTSIPYSKITNIDITEGPVERMYQVSRVHLQTAGSNAAEAAKAEGVLVGIKKSEELRAYIQSQLNLQGKSAEPQTEKSVLQEILEEIRGLARKLA